MDETAPLISCTLTYEKDGQRREKIAARLFADALVLSGPGVSHTLRLNTLSGVRAQDYRVYAETDGGVIVLSMMGHLYEDFAQRFIRAYNEVLFGELLMRETVHFEAAGEYLSPAGETARAVFRICETALVILPETHGLCRIPYCMIADIGVSPYRFAVTDRFGQVYVLAKMGLLTDAFLKAYDMRRQQLLQQTRALLNDIAPAGDQMAALLMEGMVVKMSEVRAVSSAFASALDAKLSASAIAQEYAYLKKVSGDLAVGIKRGLVGELTGESIIVLAPVFDKNMLIMESLGESAAATYVFRLTEGQQADAQQWSGFLLAFNYSMLSVNFRREPVYLSDEALQTGQYEQYRGALRRVAGLKRLRALFVGRVMHSGFDSWKKAMDRYIQ